MIKVALFAGGDLRYFAGDFDYFVGVDRGSLYLIEQGFPLDLAVGDFDSISAEELMQVTSQADRLIQAPAEKDDTDTELALKTIFMDWPEAQVTIFGAFGGRLDHLMSNLFLPSEPNLMPFLRQIKLVDAQNVVEFYPSGHQEISPQKGMTYVSFMADGDADLTISGAKYDLSPANFFKKKIYSSNEFIGKPISVTFQSGYLIVIHSKDRS